MPLTSQRVAPRPAAGVGLLDLLLLLSSALRTGTFLPDTPFQFQLHGCDIALSETNSLSFWASFGWSCLFYCNDTKHIKGDEHFMCLCRRVLCIYSWLFFNTKAMHPQNKTVWRRFTTFGYFGGRFKCFSYFPVKINQCNTIFSQPKLWSSNQMVPNLEIRINSACHLIDWYYFRFRGIITHVH